MAPRDLELELQLRSLPAKLALSPLLPLPLSRLGPNNLALLRIRRLLADVPDSRHGSVNGG